MLSLELMGIVGLLLALLVYAMVLTQLDRRARRIERREAQEDTGLAEQPVAAQRR